MKKMWSMPERITNYIKSKADELELSESEFLRRVIDEHKKREEYEEKKFLNNLLLKGSQ